MVKINSPINLWFSVWKKEDSHLFTLSHDTMSYETSRYDVVWNDVSYDISVWHSHSTFRANLNILYSWQSFTFFQCGGWICMVSVNTWLCALCSWIWSVWVTGRLCAFCPGGLAKPRPVIQTLYRVDVHIGENGSRMTRLWFETMVQPFFHFTMFLYTTCSSHLACDGSTEPISCPYPPFRAASARPPFGRRRLWDFRTDSRAPRPLRFGLARSFTNFEKS